MRLKKSVSWANESVINNSWLALKHLFTWEEIFFPEILSADFGAKSYFFLSD